MANVLERHSKGVRRRNDDLEVYDETKSQVISWTGKLASQADSLLLCMQAPRWLVGPVTHLPQATATRDFSKMHILILVN